VGKKKQSFIYPVATESIYCNSVKNQLNEQQPRDRTHTNKN